MKSISKITFFTLTFTLFIFISTQFASAQGSAEEKAEIFKNPSGRIMSAINKGDWHAYPENSIPAIQSAAEKGADIIKIDLKQTKDGKIVLFADEQINRMCYLPENTETIYVSDLSLSELSAYTLRDKQGDILAENTGHKIPTLEEALEASDSALLLLDFDWSLRDEVYKIVEKSQKLDTTIFLTRTSAKNADEWQAGLSSDIMSMGYHKGNIVFLSTSYVKNYLESGDAVWLATNNPYGMNFQNVVTKHFRQKGRAAASPAMPEICGKKIDCETWWNDLTNLGYSIIISDYPEELNNFINKSLIAEEKLDNLNAYVAENFTLPDTKADIFTEYKRSFDKATSNAQDLIDKGFAGEQSLNEAYYMLQKSVDDIEKNISALNQGKSGLTVTPARIAIAILAVFAVVAAQVYTYKKMKKQKA